MDGLTGSRERCLLVIERYLSGNGEAPTRRELAELLGQKSTKGVNQVLTGVAEERLQEVGPGEAKTEYCGWFSKSPKNNFPFSRMVAKYRNKGMRP